MVMWGSHMGKVETQGACMCTCTPCTFPRDLHACFRGRSHVHALCACVLACKAKRMHMHAQACCSYAPTIASMHCHVNTRGPANGYPQLLRPALKSNYHVVLILHRDVFAIRWLL